MNIESTKIPKVTLTGIVILYLYVLIPFITGVVNEISSCANIAEGVGYAIGLGIGSFLILIPVFLTQKDRNGARIILTVMFAILIVLLLGMTVAACLADGAAILRAIPVLAALALFSLPIVLLWSPKSNAWFRVVKAARRARSN